MKVHAFKVNRIDGSNTLENILAMISAETNLRERIRMVNRTEVRVETVEKRKGLWLIDFIKIRTDHGPGRVGRDVEIEGFDFDDDEGFGEETAALYDSSSGYILIQYNHHGVRAGVIADYLSAYDGTAANVYEFKPKYDDDVERRLLQQGITKKVVFTIDVTKMSAGDRKTGLPLSEAISFGRGSGADKIKVEISVSGTDKQRGLKERARNSVNSLLEIVGQNPDAVTKLEVSGKEDRDSVTEVLDLIAHRLSVQINDLPTDAGLRFPREERWKALIRAKNGWSRILK